MIILFWTDILIWGLVALAAAFTVYAARREHLRAPWREVARSGVAMSALVVLAVYVVIGLLDSAHFRPAAEPVDGEVRYSGETLSVFDTLVSGLRVRSEKTYSAPFSLHLYSKETVEAPDGTQSRQYLRLVYGGAHISGPEDRFMDIVWTVVLAAAKAIVLWSLLLVALAWILARRNNLSVHRAAATFYGDSGSINWGAFLITVLVVAVIGWVAMDLSAKYHVLGTDKVGDDVLYQTLKSIRTGLMIGTLTTLVMLPFAILLGLMAGYFGSWVDDMIQYLYTTLNSIPSVLLIAASILMLQVYLDNHATEFASVAERADLRLLFLCLILGVTSWTGLCRYLRAESLKLREVDYVLAARALGAGHFSIIGRHILPNVMHIVLITVVLDFSGLVLAEAVLSYVQIGVDPTTQSWGNMINSARLEMAREPIVWWSLAAAFVFMFTLVLAANLFADVVRDAFDPRLRSVQ
jgi:peptide/nickel transport system permease protein